MLILSRRVGEAIFVGEGADLAKFRILKVDGNQIQIGITAPKHISVHREEIYKRIQEEAKTPMAANS